MQTIASRVAGRLASRRTRTILWSVLIVAALTAVAGTAAATRDGARESAMKAAISLKALGFDFRDEFSLGLLEEGDKAVVRTTLLRGNDYALVAGGCSDAMDVDIQVYDEDWDLVEQDRDSEDVAVVQVSPRFTGEYYVVVRMYSTRGDAAHWVLVTGYK